MSDSVEPSTVKVITPRAAMRLVRRARDEEHKSKSYSHAGATNSTQKQLKSAIKHEAGGPSIVAALCLLILHGRTSTERLDTFEVLDYLVMRSSSVRAAVFIRLGDVILPFCCESESAKHKLPPPTNHARLLQRHACLSIQTWKHRFGKESSLLDSAANVASMLLSGTMPSQAHAEYVQHQAVMYTALLRLLKNLDDHFVETKASLENTLDLLQHCFEIIIPKFDDGNTKGTVDVMEMSRQAAERREAVLAPRTYKEGEAVPLPSFLNESKASLETTAKDDSKSEKKDDDDGEEDSKPASLELFSMLMMAMNEDDSNEDEFKAHLAQFVGDDQPSQAEEPLVEDDLPGVVSDDYKLTVEIDMESAFKQIAMDADRSLHDLMDTIRQYARVLSRSSENGIKTPALLIHKWSVQLKSFTDYSPDTEAEKASWKRAEEYSQQINALIEKMNGCIIQLNTLGINVD